MRPYFRFTLGFRDLEEILACREVIVSYEAGRDGFFPYRRLTELGHSVWVIDSASIEVSRRRRQAKSDGVDLDKLAELIQRQARGEPKALRIVRAPSQKAEDPRVLPREIEVLRLRTPFALLV